MATAVFRNVLTLLKWGGEGGGGGGGGRRGEYTVKID